MPSELEDVFRRDWPLIVGAVARYTSDLTLAEDSVQEAFARALAFTGTLRNPAAWITTTARRIAVDALRREKTHTRLLPALAREAVEGGGPVAQGSAGFDGDDRLLLIALAAHPQLGAADHVALALRFVCGESTAGIARVLLLPETTLAARLTRAKKRIAASGLAAASPGNLLPRIEAILTVLYLLFTLGHGAAASGRRTTAIALGRDVVRLLPEHLEGKGLLALLLLTEARSAGEVTDDGGTPVGLEAADRSRWDRELIDEGLALAAAALPGGGRFALQAGISGLHCAAASWAETDWPAIGRLYTRLYEVWPSPSVALNRIVALGLGPDVGPGGALSQLDRAFPSPSGPLAGQVWAARADLLRRLGRTAEAADAYRLALGCPLPEDDIRFLRRRLIALDGPLDVKGQHGE